MTTDELIEILKGFPAGTPVQFQSTDAPEYGWLEVGGSMRDDELSGTHLISNDGLAPRR